MNKQLINLKRWFSKIIILAIVLISCTKRENKNASSVQSIYLGDIVQNTSTKICPVIEDIILLETNEQSMFERIDKLVYTDSNIFILDRYANNAILMFDTKGRFIRKWTVGRGSQEFLNAEDFLISSDKHKLLVLSTYNQKIFTYSIATGEYISEQKVPIPVKRFTHLVEGEFIFEASDIKDGYLAFERDGKIMHNQITTPLWNDEYPPLLNDFKNSNILCSRLFPFDTIIYEIKSNEAIPLFHLNFKDVSPISSNGYALAFENSVVGPIQHWLTDNYLFVNYQIKNKPYISFYNLYDHETTTIELLTFGSEKEAIVFKSFIHTRGTTSNKFITEISAERLSNIRFELALAKEAYCDVTSHNIQLLLEKAKGIELSDNPALLLISL